jgi:hypothetical protein
MSEAYFRVESGALGPEENFLSLDDILMSQEKLPVRTETPLPRLGAFFLERGAGAEPERALPQVRPRVGGAEASGAGWSRPLRKHPAVSRLPLDARIGSDHDCPKTKLLMGGLAHGYNPSCSEG